MLVERDRGRRTLYLCQQTYLTKILCRFLMENCKGYSTPLDTKTRLHPRTEAEESTDLHTYQEAVLSLTYAAITTWPDLAYAARLVRRFPANPSTLHWQALKRIQRNIRVTTEHRLQLDGGVIKQAKR